MAYETLYPGLSDLRPRTSSMHSIPALARGRSTSPRKATITSHNGFSPIPAISRLSNQTICSAVSSTASAAAKTVYSTLRSAPTHAAVLQMGHVKSENQSGYPSRTWLHGSSRSSASAIPKLSLIHGPGDFRVSIPFGFHDSAMYSLCYLLH
jgi:hypothetical protein